MTSTRNRDLIDRIADALPEEQRAAYYREMMYCRSLPENDELLRVLRAMQILTFLIVQIPERVVAERKRMQELLTGCLEQFASSFQASESSRLLLEQKLIQLPGFIAAGISPETIVTEINSQLEKQFSMSTIPQLANSLEETAIQINMAVTALDGTVGRLGNTYDETVEKARKTIERMDETISRAAETAAHEAEQLSRGFHQQYWWSVFLLTTVALFVGIFAGMLLMHAYYQPIQKTERVSAPAIQKDTSVKAKLKK